MTSRAIRISEARSGLAVTAVLLDGKAPGNAEFLWRYLATPRRVPAIHAMWTGPEISCPIPSAHLDAATRSKALPPENATVTPQPGDLVLSHVPARMWGGNPDPIFDIGLFYGAGARLLFPSGWLAGSVFAEIRPEERQGLADACNAIRRRGACEIGFARADEGGRP